MVCGGMGGSGEVGQCRADVRTVPGAFCRTVGNSCTRRCFFAYGVRSWESDGDGVIAEKGKRACLGVNLLPGGRVSVAVVR